ncbi:Crp/Fnr family transcriptional regulator [Candidatus Saccharibacteria bacterium]|nr:Crp/Fnr family transcriptional regulator [Candidatus Saccharibacteria bacterium]
MFASKSDVKSLAETFKTGTALTYKKGEFIIRPGEMPSAVFYIESGLVKAYNITKYGEENLLIVRKEREVFPLIWAITGKERNVIYQTLAPTKVYRLSRKDYLNFLDTSPEALATILDMTVEMYRIHSERIMNLGYRTVRERLVSFIYTMYKRFGKETKDGFVIDVPLRQQDIASSINASRETTGRELSYLTKKGIIGHKGNLILVPDIKKLQSFF